MSLAELRAELRGLRAKTLPVSRMNKADIVRELERTSISKKKVTYESEEEPVKQVKKENKVVVKKKPIKKVVEEVEDEEEPVSIKRRTNKKD
jgi:hypothetical protein